MASYVTASREFARISTGCLRRNGATRAFRTASRSLAAQNFTMPAMSPTMTEGNIANWKVKEGDSFSTGDVLLEIETDKAQMEVEAQDDGKLAKITQPDGSKGVKVGSRIAVIAETDDTLSTLSIPPEDSASAPSPQEDLKSGVDPSHSSESQAEAPPSSKGVTTPSSSSSSSSPDPARPTTTGKPTKQAYPLYPSIAALLHEKGIPASEVDQIPTSGPKGRLLKGDVLAHLGRISKSYPTEQSARITKLGHLDLSNIQIAPPAKAPAGPPASSSEELSHMQEPEVEPETEVAVSISLKSVLEVQKRIQDTLGVTMPLSTFVARATEVANDELPRSENYRPSADELFYQVLGLDKVNIRSSRGAFMPQVTALPPTSSTLRAPAGPQKGLDIIDILTGNRPTTAKPKVGPPPPGIMAGSESGAATNVFSVSVAQGEEKRARIFLERVKTILQVEPGRLVI